MSREIGMAALRLEAPPRVARTEYSFLNHWDLIEAETGIACSEAAPPEEQDRARTALLERWAYDFHWDVLVRAESYLAPRGRITDMGHAEYAAGGVDRRNASRCPFEDPEDFLELDFEEEYGTHAHADLVRAFNEHYAWNCARFPDAACMTGIYITCISGLIDILGWDMLLLAAGTDAEAFGRATERYAAWAGQFFRALADCDAPVIMVHDDMVWTSGPFIHPDWYRRYVFPSLARNLEPLRQAGKIIVFTADGDYTCFIDDIARCGANAFVMEPTTDMALVAERYGRTHAFLGNADTRILLDGTRDQIRAEVERCMRIGKDCPGYFLAVGNHIPPNTPIENARYYNECFESLANR